MLGILICRCVHTACLSREGMTDWRLSTGRLQPDVDEGAPGNDAAAGVIRELAYDHLILTLGSVSNYLGMQNVQNLACAPACVPIRSELASSTAW